MTAQIATFTTPVGRLIGGSVYKQRTTDHTGRPRLYNKGPRQGQPRVDYNIGVAIPKGPEVQQHPTLGWLLTEWGAIIRATAEAWDRNATARPDFAWKVVDGDSTTLNKNQKRPCDQEGHPGHWVLWFTSEYAPKVYTLMGGVREPQLLDMVDAINPGDYVQVAGTVKANGESGNPGVYLNQSMVCLIAYGQRIQSGPDVSAAGFGKGVTLPAGAMQTPPAGFAPPATTAPQGLPAMPPALGAPAGLGAPALPAAAPSMPAPLPTPNPAFLQVPGQPATLGAPSLTPPALPAAAALPMPPGAMPAAPQRVMLPAAAGGTYEQLRALGWTDELLVSRGMMRIG